MKRLTLTATAAAAFILLALPLWFTESNTPVAIAQAATPTPSAFPAAQSAYPTQLLIPSIALNDQVVNVGLTAQGDMDVPSGNTSEVGWYSGGTVPGEKGSAVFDAHVFAAFKNLDKVRVGDDLYVLTASGMSLHFKVTQATVYPLSQVPAQQLFNKTDGKYLNLITCAGTFVRSMNTYDHRLVVYATLAD